MTTTAHDQDNDPFHDVVGHIAPIEFLRYSLRGQSIFIFHRVVRHSPLMRRSVTILVYHISHNVPRWQVTFLQPSDSPQRRSSGNVTRWICHFLPLHVSIFQKTHARQKSCIPCVTLGKARPDKQQLQHIPGLPIHFAIYIEKAICLPHCLERRPVLSLMRSAGWPTTPGVIKNKRDTAARITP